MAARVSRQIRLLGSARVTETATQSQEIIASYRKFGTTESQGTEKSSNTENLVTEKSANTERRIMGNSANTKN
jgi:hypothetical protein